MVKSEQIYSPQNYLEAVTGNCYIISGDNDVEEIETILEKLDCCLWSHALTEIGYIVENKLDVVLVECMVYNEKTEEFEHVYRWFEVPEDFEEEREV
jgi:hypothetical protein